MPQLPYLHNRKKHHLLGSQGTFDKGTSQNHGVAELPE